MITAKMPRASLGTGFTYLFESFEMIFVHEISIFAVVKLLARTTQGYGGLSGIMLMKSVKPRIITM